MVSISGKPYNHTKKMEVAASLKAAQKHNGGRCPVHEEVNDVTEFSVFVEHHGHVLILDNASIHNQGSNSVLEDCLCEHC